MQQKKQTDYTILLIGIIILIAALCSCNDAETPTRQSKAFAYVDKPAMQIVEARDYQLEIIEDSLLIFDGNRFVGAIPFHYDTLVSPIDSLIMADNE